ncbi:DNA gyrase subunit A [Candidatus Gracilibacteria bacterium]|nr:DNA gyrase subunit A [Candidatus Gracilibacteria bacterium]
MSENQKPESEETPDIVEDNVGGGDIVVHDDTSLKYDGDSARSISEEMESCYMEYAMSVIISRALPDVRDGFKPVHRRILFSMNDQGLRPGAKYRKSASVVGDVLAKYHPHGDNSVYDAMVRMAQDFSLRYPIVDGQGNFGSMDGDGAAAYRYTEAKMSKIAEQMLADIDKETVDFRDNFDTTRQEPTVMPTRIPNLLMNGVMGIAVGMATNIPPHNLSELILAIKHILLSPNPEEITIENLMEFVKGPDFPTGGIVYDKEALLTAYSTGRGSVIVRGVASIEENKKGRKYIHISEVPFGMNKSNFIEKIADLVRDKKIVGISDIRDESNKDGVRVIVDLKKDSFPKKILNQLYKLTQLQTSFGYNMIALGDRGIQPRLFNLKEILGEFIDHRKEVVTRRTQYELKIAEARAHILEGLKKALDHIDEIIKTIRASDTKEDAKQNLMATWDFSSLQADAILEMRLQKLAGLERQKIEDELKEKMNLIADLKDILAKPERVITIIDGELDVINESYGDERRTRVNAGKVGEFNAKDTIPNEDIVVVLTKNNYVKRLKASSFRTQRRGGKGITTATKDDDEIYLVVPTTNHADLLFFTTKGRVFTLPAYEIPETTRIAKGQPIINLLNLQKDEEIAAILDITREQKKYLFFVSRSGIVKKLDMEQVKNIRANGLKVVGVKEDDDLLWVKTTTGNDNIFIATREGKAIQFHEDDVRSMGRAAAGVKGISLKPEDRVIEVAVVGEENKFVFIVTQNGLGKITDIDAYRNQKRGGSGVKAMAVTEKTGKLVSAKILTEEDRKESDILLISKSGQTIRLNLNGVRKTSRVTQGVILTKLKNKSDMIVRASVIRESEDEEVIDIEKL